MGKGRSPGSGVPRAGLQADFRRLGLTLDPRTLEQAGQYLQILEIWRTRMDLTGDLDSGELATRFFSEAIPALPLLDEFPGTVADVGSGGGFPGIPLAIMRREREVVLIEPRLRRGVFLRTVVRNLELRNVRVETCRFTQAPLGPEVSTLALRGLAVADLDLARSRFFASRRTPFRILIWTASGRGDVDPGVPFEIVRRAALPMQPRSEILVLAVHGSGTGAP